MKALEYEPNEDRIVHLTMFIQNDRQKASVFLEAYD